MNARAVSVMKIALIAAYGGVTAIATAAATAASAAIIVPKRNLSLPVE
jgi:hypothetical protein